MTLIVTNGKEMAADSLLAFGDVSAECDKLFRVSGAILGCAGDSDKTIRFQQWREKSGRRPRFKETDSFEAIEVNAAGILLYDYSLVPTPLRMDFYAIGIDAIAALVLLKRGATIQECINEVATYSRNVRGPVVTWQLEE